MARRSAGSVRPAANSRGRVHDACTVKKTIAMLFESPNAKLYPAFNIPPPVRLRSVCARGKRPLLLVFKCQCS